MLNYNLKNEVEVLLINPPSSKGKFGRGQFSTPPMGLAYLASYLQSKGISVDIIDCNPEKIFIDYFMPIEAQKRELAKVFDSYKQPLIVGIGPLTTPFLTNGLAIAKFSKDYFKNSYVVIGGPHPSVSPPEMAERMLKQFEYIDAICINEGEKTLFELVTKLKSGNTNEIIEGILFRPKNGSYYYKDRKLIDSCELDTLPFPNRDLLKKYSDKYKLAVRRNFLKIISDENLRNKYGNSPKFTVIFSTRGCPYQCTFCSTVHQRRLRSAENVISEIEFCINNYDIHCFVFYDNLFTTSSPLEIERVKKICNLIIGKKLEVYWEVELRADIICKLDKNVLNLMNNAGCYTVNIGIEKATDEALSWLQKGLNISQIKEAIEILKKSGNFIINGTFIFGGPSETEKDILNIINFSKYIGIDYAAYYPLEIHPGTKIFSCAKELGLVNDILTPYITKFNYYPIFTNPNLNIEALMQLQCRAYREFYFDTNYIESLIKKTNSISTVYAQYEHFFEHAFVEGVR